MAQSNSARRGHKHTLADLLSGSLTAGDVLYVNASGVLVTLPKGTDSQVLTLASGLPSWAAAGGEVNDLSAVVTWANVPAANIVEAAVTQHEAALTIIEGQITGAAFSNWNTAFGWGDHSGLYEAIDADIARTDVDDVVTAHWSVPSTINTQNGNYTAVIGDAGKTIRKASGGAGETFTIPANASVAYPLGTFLAFDNEGGGDLTIAITTDTLIWADDGTTGSRTLADSGYAVAQKVEATVWKIAGKQLT